MLASHPEGRLMRITRFFLPVVFLASIGAGVIAQTQRPANPSQTAQAPPAAQRVTTPKEEWGHDVGDDYFLANYQQLMAYWRSSRKSRRACSSSISARPREAADADGDHHVAGQPSAARALQGHLDAGSRSAEGLTDDAGARARARRQGGRLDRRRAARQRDARRAAADRARLPDGQPHRRGDDAHSWTT